MTMDNGLNPVCKECGCWYPVEYSIHMDYCDECYKEILKTVEKSRKIKKENEKCTLKEKMDL